jgi:uncharacterized protein (TIGR02147 family)
MLDLLTYTDYQKFLKDYFEFKKRENPNFSYCLFSRKADIPSKGLLYNVLQGKRNLPKGRIRGMCQALSLDKHQSNYFKKLVLGNRKRIIKYVNEHTIFSTVVGSRICE